MRIFQACASAVLAFAMSAVAQTPQDKPPAAPQTPAQQYESLVKEYTGKQNEFYKAYREAKTSEERKKALAEKQPKASDYVAKFLDIADKNPKDPVAGDALIWVLSNGSGRDPQWEKTREKVIDNLIAGHMANKKLANV